MTHQFKTLLDFEGVLYTVRKNTHGLFWWTNLNGEEFGAPFVSPHEAINWARLMIRYEWQGRARLIERSPVISKGEV